MYTRACLPLFSVIRYKRFTVPLVFQMTKEKPRFTILTLAMKSRIVKAQKLYQHNA